MIILFLTGCSGVGKSSLISAFEALPSDFRVATVRAWQIAQDHVGAAFVSGKRLCVVDSFPRKEFQVDDIMKRWPEDARFVHLYCDEKVRTDRLTLRDNSDPVKWQHTLLRMKTEESEVYRVLCKIINGPYRTHVMDTSKYEIERYAGVAQGILRWSVENERIC